MWRSGFSNNLCVKFNQFHGLPKDISILGEPIGPLGQLEHLRWNRKPRWVPVAKSKMFRIAVKPVIPKEERDELKRLNGIYSVQLRAIRRLFFEEYLKTASASSAAKKAEEMEEEEHRLLLAENDAWNAQIAAVRQLRLEKERAMKQERALCSLVKVKEEEERLKAKAREIVLKEVELSSSYITRENVDKAIEEALSNPTDYEYAIDLEGHIYRGRKTKPTDIPPNERERLSVPLDDTPDEMQRIPIEQKA